MCHTFEARDAIMLEAEVGPSALGGLLHKPFSKNRRIYRLSH